MFLKPRDGSLRKQLILIANLFQKYTKWSEVYSFFSFSRWMYYNKVFYLNSMKIIFFSFHTYIHDMYKICICIQIRLKETSYIIIIIANHYLQINIQLVSRFVCCVSKIHVWIYKIILRFANVYILCLLTESKKNLTLAQLPIRQNHAGHPI